MIHSSPAYKVTIMPPSFNDNDGFDKRPPREEPDAHGQAALILAESILHTLIETRTFTREQALQVIQTAVEVKIDVATEARETNGRMQESLALLSMIARSLETDIVRIGIV